MQKIKKIFSLILALSLCLGLCSCGAIEKERERLNIRLKGDGSKKLRLSVFTELPEGYETCYTFGNEGEVFPLAAEEKVSKQKGTYKYNIVAAENAESGVYSCSIYYANANGDVFGSVKMILGVAEDGKLTCHNIELEGNSEYKPIEAEDESNLPEQAEVSNFTGNSKDIKLANTNGRWYIQEGSFDENIIDPELLEQVDKEDDSYSLFRVYGIGKGVSDLVLYNSSDDVQLCCSFAVTVDEDPQMQNGEEQYIIELTSSKSIEYNETESKEYKEEQTSAINMIRHALSDAYIPAVASFNSCYVYKFSDPDHYADFEAYKSAAEAYNNAAEDQKDAAKAALDSLFSGCDSAEVVFEKDGCMYGFSVTRAVDIDALLANLVKEITHSEAKELALGGKTIKYIMADDGFGAAVFGDGKYAYSLVGMASFTEEEFTAAVSDIFSSASKQ